VTVSPGAEHTSLKGRPWRTVTSCLVCAVHALPFGKLMLTIGILSITLSYSVIPVNRKVLTGKTVTFNFAGMLTVISIKVDPRMKKALEKLAEKEFTSVSGLIKKGAEKVLQDHGIDWREEKSGD
jgi:xanthosine utilization system XapX-like protein